MAKGSVRSFRVIVLHQRRDLYSSIIHAEEQRLIEEFVTHAAVETLDAVVLNRRARRDICGEADINWR